METVLRCKRCGYKTDRIANLKNHFKRKRVCDDVLACGLSITELVQEIDKDSHFCCNYCGQKFQTKQGVNQHQSICKPTPSTSSLQQELEEIKQENQRLREELLSKHHDSEEAFDRCSTNITNHITNNNNYNITIVLNDFGKEDISHVQNDVQFLQGCMKELYSTAIESVIKKIYFDEEYPENQNIKMQNIKMNQVMVREDGEWKRCNITGPAMKMVTKGKNILHTYYLTSGEAQKEIDRMMEEGDICPDRKIVFLNKLCIPDTNEHKIAVSQIKGVISNFKFKTK